MHTTTSDIEYSLFDLLKLMAKISVAGIVHFSAVLGICQFAFFVYNRQFLLVEVYETCLNVIKAVRKRC